jgi:hypothetical protein
LHQLRPVATNSSILFIIAFLSCARAVAHEASSPCPWRNKTGYTYASHSVDARAAIDEGRRLLDFPSVKLIRVLNASTSWEERGQMNHGAFEITAPGGGSVALKILNGAQFLVRRPEDRSFVDFDGELPTHGGIDIGASRFREYLDLHALLGRLHTAPKLIAVLSGPDLRHAARTRWPFLKEAADTFRFDTGWISRSDSGMGNRIVGVVMEKLPLLSASEELHPLNRPAGLPLFMRRWSRRQVDQAIHDLIEIRRRTIAAGATLYDRQFVVTTTGHAYLIDLDQARFDPYRAPDLNISMEINKVISLWEILSGRVFGSDRRRRALSEAARPYFACQTDEELAPLTKNWRNCEDPLSAP